MLGPCVTCAQEACVPDKFLRVDCYAVTIPIGQTCGLSPVEGGGGGLYSRVCYTREGVGKACLSVHLCAFPICCCAYMLVSLYH